MGDKEPIAMQDINPPEKRRTYRFANGEVSFEHVRAVGVRKSGTHRIETVDGLKHIVPAGWLAITLDIDDWTF